MSKLVQEGELYGFAPKLDSLLDSLPVGNYRFISTSHGYRFGREESFPHLENLYGDHQKIAERIFKSFLERESNTGALFAGTKGSGKSVLGRLISQLAYESNIPTVLITEKMDGETLRELLDPLEQRVIVFIDEFEKLYRDENSQQSFLGLLDGVSTSKHLFILTVNDVSKVDSHLRNRPGRIYYYLEFNGVDEKFVRDYCAIKLQDSSHVEEIVEISNHFSEFNFDMLKSLVEEMNRFQESPREALRYLNLSPEDELNNYYTITHLNESGEDKALDTWLGNPLVEDVRTEYWDHPSDEKKTISLTRDSLTKKNVKEGEFIYSTENGLYRLELVNSRRGRVRRKDWF